MGRRADRRLYRRRGRRPARAAAGRHAEAGACGQGRDDAHARPQVAGADAADVPPGPAAARPGSRRHASDRRSERGRGDGPRAAARARLARKLQAHLCTRLRAGRAPAEDTRMTRPIPPRIRIGEGWDTHALVTGRPLILGGVEVPHTHGLLGHSDADALCHAITDALFGALALGDIGHHFPDTDERFKGADSLALLAEAARRVKGAGWRVGNVDGTIVAQA